MISHALTIVRNELEPHLAASGNSTHAELGNVGEVAGTSPGERQSRGTRCCSRS